jgi:hypothetical protein
MSPYTVYRDELSAREDLERPRRPTLEFSLPSPPVIQSIDLRGSTTVTYRIVLQVGGDELAPQQIELEIVAGEGLKPVSGIWRGAARVAIVARAAPRLEG